MKNKIITISDIAKKLDVSKSTVSRALNNSPLISDKVKDSINQFAKEHNFQFNQSARNLSLQKTNTLAYLFPCLPEGEELTTRPFPMEILRGAIYATSKLGYNLLLGESQYDAWHDLYKYINSNQADGLIILSANPHDQTILELLDRKIKFVTWGMPENKGYSTVNSNNLEGGMLATQHLIDKGRKNIAFIGGMDDEYETILRLLAVDNVILKNKLTLHPDKIVYSFHSVEAGYESMKNLLEKDPTIDGVVTCSDLMAFGAIDAVKSKGKKVPEDISIIGFGDFSFARLVTPAITTIRQNVLKVGEELVKNLDIQLKTGEIINSTLPVELVIREST